MLFISLKITDVEICVIPIGAFPSPPANLLCVILKLHAPHAAHFDRVRINPKRNRPIIEKAAGVVCRETRGRRKKLVRVCREF